MNWGGWVWGAVEEAGGWHREPFRAAREVAVVALGGRWAEPPILLGHSWLGAEYFLPRLADWMTWAEKRIFKKPTKYQMLLM